MLLLCPVASDTMAVDANSLEKGSGGGMPTPGSKQDMINVQSNTKGDCETIHDLKSAAVADLDEAQLFLHEHGIPNSRLEELMSDESALKKLRKKVDWQLMPLL